MVIQPAARGTKARPMIDACDHLRNAEPPARLRHALGRAVKSVLLAVIGLALWGLPAAKVDLRAEAW